MKGRKLGRLEEVDIRDIWNHEQLDFSNWLAKDENIELINETIGLTLTDIEKEVYVGSYRCDLVAVDETSSIKVIIENQLGPTDHDHLGKIITYASGLDAEVIIWIVKEAREEHKSAIEWLNNNMAKDISFFLLEIHAYRIGDSLPAAKFVVIEEPNDFVKITGSYKEEMTKTEADRLNFWNQFNDFLIEKGRPFNVRKASTDNWYDVAIGSSQAHLVITLVQREKRIGVELHISDNKDLFDQLYLQKDEIEEKLGFNLTWHRLDNNKLSKIQYFITGLDFDDQGNYPELMEEIVEKILAMRRVFTGYL